MLKSIEERVKYFKTLLFKPRSSQEDLDVVQAALSGCIEKYTDDPSMLGELAMMCDEHAKQARSFLSELKRQVGDDE